MISFNSLPPPDAANDNDLRLGRRGGETYHQAMIRAKALGTLPRAPDTETPLEKALRDGRVDQREAGDLAATADFVALQVEQAIRQGAVLAPRAMKFLDVVIPGGGDFSRPIGQEVTADVRRTVYEIRRSAGDRWAAVSLAVLYRATMQDIGRHYGAPVRRAAATGLSYVLAGLRRIERDHLQLPERRFLLALAA